NYINRPVDSKLSGGEIKRIEIAGVLVRRSKLLLFDEPEAGIDLWSFNNLIRVFEDIRESRKLSVVIISHQERLINIADEIIMINQGSVGLHGSRDKIFPNLLCKKDCDTCAVGQNQ
ncbi:MAG: ATP-binding cassette domain-containing protein, partial [Firmicutes bacterium]|nr:ATP-binding cassette domain-containing protein [Bacillota bacterium]